MVVLFGGPAGAGKTTLARAWCLARERAVHIELDEIRSLIVSGLADPQVSSAFQAEQYELSVAATCVLARTFAEASYEVAIDDVLEPETFQRSWRPRLEGLDWQTVIILPTLENTLSRAADREKRVLEDHIRSQHAACSEWPAPKRLDTTGLSLDESLQAVAARIGDGSTQ